MCSRKPCAQKHYLFQFIQPFLKCLHTNRKTIELSLGLLDFVISKPEVFGVRLNLDSFQSFFQNRLEDWGTRHGAVVPANQKVP